MELSSVSQLDQVVRSVAWDRGMKGRGKYQDTWLLLLVLGLKKVSSLEKKKKRKKKRK